MAKKEEQKLLFNAILPQTLKVQIHKAEEGGYWAKVSEVPCYSQGETFTELFDVLTKAVYAYYNVPEKLISELGSYLPVLSLKEIIAEGNPPETYTLDDILPKQKLGDIRELQRIS
jgi:predicted RNase H-like HicB family nuclease